jgi:hypothetical protein
MVRVAVQLVRCPRSPGSEIELACPHAAGSSTLIAPTDSLPHLRHTVPQMRETDRDPSYSRQAVALGGNTGPPRWI